MNKIKSNLLQLIIVLAIYSLTILIFKEYYFLVFSVLVVFVDNFIFSKSKNFTLFLIVPLLAIILLFFDLDSIYRSARFIVMFPILLTISIFFKNILGRIIVSCFIIIVIHFLVNPNWASFYRNQIKNETIMAKTIKELKLDDLSFLNSNKEVYVLDLWYTKCPACYQNMKQLKSWAESNIQYKDNIILVNILLDGEEFEKNKTIVDEYGFNSTYSKLNFNDFKELGVYTYPKQIVIRNDEIIFVGDLETDKKVIINNIKDYLN